MLCEFWYVVFSFQNIFSSSCDSFLTQGLFRRVLFTISTYMDFLDIFVIDSYLSMVGKHISYDINPLKFIEICFMVDKVVYLGVCFIHTWKRCVFYLYCIKHSTSIHLVKMFDSVMSPILLLILCLLVLSVIEKGSLTSLAIIVDLPVSLFRSASWILKLHC